ncbi:GNAT family N-acetyltransferase [Sinorhizobium alkalisoli]|uniref:GNAT family acetyltransferase n=1 Tax=Sinorhizobium alkalisoli TaxID=1752398 RepID=A0A1E3V8Y0_9HYPH|nr:GNAT family N-acetyltransferase [Sinorhizobium alkalisoli]MCA1491002.1 GNAT family N-acetyltransferase [Ensifer sp. NBAIM29]MCG5479006.1 GNAT family N-acetyltransferase [Sinorhizobium alkalisoli]ODR90000.1 GNAT family acetyltransferase [Sinorhizobium alkalisoli]QFI68483.1 Acetyltransferase, GNAT family [Sinorhizobium alkalisoli]
MNAPSPDLHIRAASVADWKALALLRDLPGVRAGTLRQPFAPPERTREWLENRGEGDMVIVAEIEETIVGLAGLHRHKGRRQHAAELGMSVHDDYRRRGIGRAMLNALIEAADRWLGIARLELTVFTENEAAIGLYRQAGFVTEGVLKSYALRDGMLADVFAMARIRE